MSHKVFDNTIVIDSEADIDYNPSILNDIPEIEQKISDSVEYTQEELDINNQIVKLDIEEPSITLSIDVKRSIDSDEHTNTQIAQPRFQQFYDEVDDPDETNIRKIDNKIFEQLESTSDINRIIPDMEPVENTLELEFDDVNDEAVPPKNLKEESYTNILGDGKAVTDKVLSQNRNQTRIINFEIDKSSDNSINNTYNQQLNTEADPNEININRAMVSDTEIRNNFESNMNETEINRSNSLETSFEDIDEQLLPQLNNFNAINNKIESTYNDATNEYNNISSKYMADDINNTIESRVANNNNLTQYDITNNDESRIQSNDSEVSTSKEYTGDKSYFRDYDKRIRRITKREQLTVINLLLSSLENTSIVPEYHIMDADYADSIENIVNNAIQDEYDSILNRIIKIVENVAL